MNTNLEQRYQDLIAAKNEFNNGAIKAVEYAHKRETAIKLGLTEVAKDFDVTFDEPLIIKGNGEFMFACKTGFRGFAQYLNAHHPRCGIGATTDAIMDAKSGWCYINHFEAEKLFKNYYQEQLLMDNHIERIKNAGYTIECHNVGTNFEGWWALLPGETFFKDESESGGNHNYLGFFSRLKELVEELIELVDTDRANEIKTQHFNSDNCKMYVDDTIALLLKECNSIFKSEDEAIEFLLIDEKCKPNVERN